jgi:hypothetical protein
MIGIAVDVAHLTISQVHTNAAAAGAHVAGGGAYLGSSAGDGRGGGVVQGWTGHEV